MADTTDNAEDSRNAGKPARTGKPLARMGLDHGMSQVSLVETALSPLDYQPGTPLRHVSEYVYYDSQRQRRTGELDYAHWLAYGVQVTDANAAFFDPDHNFHGCIAGIHEVLRRQGLMQGHWCLNPNESLSPGQLEEIDRVYRAYPHLHDDEFVAQHLDAWLR